MPALQIIALDTTTPQLRAPASGDTYSAPRAIELTPETLTGSSATSALAISQTWNTTGTPTAIDLNVTDTASNNSSLFMRFQRNGSLVAHLNKFGTFLADAFTGGSATQSWFAANSSLVSLRSAGLFGWTSSATSALTTQDVILARDAANTLALRNGVNAQAFRVYNTFTDASNYERGVMAWSSNILQIGTQAAGTGTARSVQVVAGTTSFFFNSDEVAVFPTTGSVQFNGRFRFSSPALGIVRLTEHNGANAGALELPEWAAAPAAPAANNVRIYAEDNGAGKTRLMARFATGAAQQIAIEP